MAAFRFSRRAEADLLSIGDYTLRTWGKAQADRYIGELEVCCQMLADNPALGRLCDDVRPGLRRLEHGRHVVFYRQERRMEAYSSVSFSHSPASTHSRLPRIDMLIADDQDNEPDKELREFAQHLRMCCVSSHFPSSHPSR